jgi:hypothetical protein
VDRLEQMLEDQWAIQANTFGYQFDRLTPAERVTYIKEMVLAATHELHEALDETTWKSWQSTGVAVFPERYMDELVDAQLMLFNLFLATGMNPNEVADLLVERVAIKQKLNVQRQESGY